MPNNSLRVRKKTTLTTPLRQWGAGKMFNVNPHDYLWAGPRSDRSDQTNARQALSPSPLLLDPRKRPVYAGDVGPGTWVVEVPGRAVPVTVPRGAVAVLAGFVSPHAYVVPVYPIGHVPAGALRSIA